MSDTNRAEQPQKVARGLKFRKQRDCALYGAYQLHSYRAANVRHYFCICKSRFSHYATHLAVAQIKSVFLDNKAIILLFSI